MPWHAVDALDDAFEATKRLLLPFSLGRWLVLALIAFFISGTTGLNPSFSFGLPDAGIPPAVEPGPGPGPGGLPEPIEEEIISEIAAAPALGGTELLIALVAVGVAVVIGVAALYVAAVMEFVFVDALVREEVRIRGFFGNSASKGLALFAFRIGVGIVVLAAFVAFVVLTVLTGGLFLILAVLLSPFLILLGIGVWILLRFTADFVVPVMLAEDVGLLEGWRRFWPALRREWKQYGVYAVARFLLGIVAAVVVGIGIAAAAMVLLIPFGLVGLFGFLLFSGVATETTAAVFLAGLGVLFVLVLAATVIVFVQVPVQTYLRYYSLFVLGAISPAFDLVDDLRPAVE